MNRTRRWALLAAGVAVGFVLRCLLLERPGTFDMGEYIRWGTGALDAGLARAYAGIYFPFQYQIFELCVRLARAFAVEPRTMVKCANLLFDAGNCALIVAWLDRRGANILWALLYWLHPWFLAAFALGYVDFQITFFLLLTIWLLQRGDSPADYGLAGVPFAAVALMKPQVILLAWAIVCYAAVSWKRARTLDVACLLVPTAIVGAAYELYFAAALWSPLGLRALILLPMSYVRTGSVMPVMTAQMLNAWYPIAYALKAPGAEIWTVSSKLDALPFVQVRFVALVLVTSVIAWYAYVLGMSKRPLSASDRLGYLLTFAALIVPAIMTSAHENHLFVATALLVPVLATGVTASVHIAIQALLAIQVLNVEGIYGADRFAAWLHPIYSFDVRVAFALVSIVCFLVVARHLYAAVQPGPLLQA